MIHIMFTQLKIKAKCKGYLHKFCVNGICCFTMCINKHQKYEEFKKYLDVQKKNLILKIALILNMLCRGL